MVLYVSKWDIHPDKVEAYLEWSRSAVQRSLGIPGVVEFRAYRSVFGTSQVVITYEFVDLDAWATW